MPDIKVLLVAENPLARMGLAALLAGINGLIVAGQSSGNQLATDLDFAKPDVIAWDWSWNTMPELPRDMPIVALLKESSQAAEAWRAGARGEVSLHFPAQRLRAGCGLFWPGEGAHFHGGDDALSCAGFRRGSPLPKH